MVNWPRFGQERCAMLKAALPANTIKGRIAESIVAALHENDESTQVECNVQLPAKNGTGRTREIDVLLTGYVGGYALRVAIECKNYNKRVGVPKIDEFVGKLRDVGLPKQSAIFVSAVGFTKDALEVAAEHGIRTLLLEGLSDDRLAAKVFQAMGSTLYVHPTLTKISIKGEDDLGMDLTARRELDPNTFPTTIFDVHNQRNIFVADVAAEVWKKGLLDKQLGKLDVTVEIGENVLWATVFQIYTWRITQITLSFEVKAFAYTIPGRGEFLMLKNVVNQSVERHKQTARFPDVSEIEFTELNSQLDLFAYQNQYSAIVGEDWHFTRVIHLPRVQNGGFYFPLSKRFETQFLALPNERLTPEAWAQLIGNDIDQIGWEE